MGLAEIGVGGILAMMVLDRSFKFVSGQLAKRNGSVGELTEIRRSLDKIELLIRERLPRQ